MKNNIRYIARIFIELTSGFAINSGDKSLLLDNNISRDANGLPYIPGTTIAGIVQQACYGKPLSQAIGKLFGYTKADARKKGIKKSEEMGSRLIFSSAHLLAADNKTVIDGLTAIDFEQEYYKAMVELPQRDHVRMTERGVADTVRHGKFDREIIYKGTRFCFEVELTGEEGDEKDWKSLLKLFHDSTLRIGSGTRKGMGRFSVLTEKSKYWKFDLSDKTDLDHYLDKSSNLNSLINKEKESLSFPEMSKESGTWKKYDLALIAKDFFLFGAGFPDGDADNTPKKELIIEWENDNPILKEKYLIPATGIKGAIAHRVAFHYNKKQGAYIGSQDPIQAAQFGWKPEEVLNDNLRLPNVESWKSDSEEWEKAMTDLKDLSFDDFMDTNAEWKRFQEESENYGVKKTPDPIGENNEAVAALFGTAKDNSQEGHIGRVIIDDIYETNVDAKVFNHVKIDRFTGGAYNGALFQEKVLATKKTIHIPIVVNTEKINQEIMDAFDSAIADIKEGRLSLGAATAKGYGMFYNNKNTK